MATHELTQSVSNGPLSSNSYLFGAVDGSSDSAPDAFLITLVYDYIKSRTDFLYPTLAQYNSVLDTANGALNQGGGYWLGQSMPTTGFADAVDATGLVTKSQAEAIAGAAGVNYVGLPALTDIDQNNDILQIYDVSAAKYCSVTLAEMRSDVGLGTEDSPTFSGLGLASGSVITWDSGDVTLTLSSGLLTLAGGNLAVPEDAYAAGWNGSAIVPTKNAVYDKIELILGTTLPATYQPLDADLTAIAAFSSTGFAVRTASDTWVQRSVAVSGAGLSISNGNGVSGNPTISLADDVATIEALTPTNDDILQRKAGAWTNRTIAQLLTDLASPGTTFQPLDSDLTSWAGVTRASGFDTFTATPSIANLMALLTDDATGLGTFLTTPSSVNLKALVTDETGSGALVFGTGPTISDLIATGSPTAAGATWIDLGTITTADINGGTIDGTIIGGASAAAGTFTAIVGTSLSVGTGGVATVGTIEIGHASANTLAASGGHMTIEGATVWDSGNDGSGSGLDADLLDGKNIGTSGNTVPLLDGANTWSGVQTFGNAGVVVGASTPFSDAAGVLTLQNVDALDATTESTIEAAIDTLANLTSIQGTSFTFGAYAPTILNNTSESGFKQAVNLEIGVDVQAYDADLASWASVTRASGFDTFVATPSSVNLKSLVTDETGSGALVFANTPTLVTPLLGTPSSGTLTNCTGLPVTGLSASASGRIFARYSSGAGAGEEITPAQLSLMMVPTTSEYNIIAYGAVGDDSTDNTTAIQNALDAIKAAGGGALCIPVGVFRTGALTYDISATSDPTTDRLTIRGINEAVSRLKATTNLASPILTYTGATGSNQVGYLSIENVAFEGDGSYTSDQVGIVVDNAAFCSFEGINCSVLQYGMRVVDVDQSVWDGCTFRWNTFGMDVNNIAAPNVTGPNSLVFINCNFSNNTLWGCYIDNPQACTFQGGSFQYNGNSSGSSSCWGFRCSDTNSGEGYGTLGFYGVIFEGNRGQADLWLDEDNNFLTTLIEGCGFYRLVISGTSYHSTNHVRLDGSIGAGSRTYFNGNTFFSDATYSPDGARPCISNPNASALIFNQGNNYFENSLETPSFANQFYSPVQIVGKGTATNDNAAAGFLGEIITAEVLAGSAVSLTNNTPANVTSISLTAGDWDVDGNIYFVPDAATTSVAFHSTINTTSAVLPDKPNKGAYNMLYNASGFAAGSAMVLPTGTIRLSLSATTTVYLIAQCGFAVNTMAASGYLRARRVR